MGKVEVLMEHRVTERHLTQPNAKEGRAIMKTTFTVVTVSFIISAFSACGYNPSGTRTLQQPDADPVGRGRQVESDAGTITGTEITFDTMPASPDSLVPIVTDTMPNTDSILVVADTQLITQDVQPTADTMIQDSISPDAMVPDSISSDTKPVTPDVGISYIPAKIPAGFKALIISNLTTKPDVVVKAEYTKSAEHLLARGFTSVDIARVNPCTSPCKSIVDADGNPLDPASYQITYIPRQAASSLPNLSEIKGPVIIHNSVSYDFSLNINDYAQGWQPDEFIGVVTSTGVSRDNYNIDIVMPSAQIAAKMIGTVSLGTLKVTPELTTNLGTFSTVVVPVTAHVVATNSYKGNDYTTLFYYLPGDTMATIAPTDPKAGLKRTPTATRKIVGFPISVAGASPETLSLFDASIDWLMGL